MSYSSITWLPLTAGLTILGFVLTYFIYQRRGLRPALMAAAWSLLPIAAYLTGATQMLWKIGAAIGQFGTGFVFSPTKWIGVGVTGLAIALFLAAGGRQRRKAAREGREARKATRGGRRDETESAPGTPGLTAAKTTPSTQILPTARKPVTVDRASDTASARGSRKTAPVDDDMKDIEDILRKRGI